MASASDFETKSIRIFNETTKKAYWVSANGDGAMELSEVNSDVTYVPNLLKDPVSLPATPVYTTGIPTVTNLEFDGLLGAASIRVPERLHLPACLAR